MMIYLTGEVNDEMYKVVLELYYQYKAETIESPTLDIFLNTEGGEIYQGLAIYDLIQLIKQYTNVRVICAGYVASSGITILLAGHRQAALPNATMMIHYGEISCGGLAEQKHNKKLFDLHINMLYDNLFVNKATILSWHNGDHFFNAERALDVGLIDEII